MTATGKGRWIQPWRDYPPELVAWIVQAAERSESDPLRLVYPHAYVANSAKRRLEMCAAGLLDPMNADAPGEAREAAGVVTWRAPRATAEGWELRGHRRRAVSVAEVITPMRVSD